MKRSNKQKLKSKVKEESRKQDENDLIEEYEQDDYDSEEDRPKKRKQKGKKPIKKRPYNKFIDDEAEEEDDENSDNENKHGEGRYQDQFYKPEELMKKSNRFDFNAFEQKYQDDQNQEDQEDIEQDYGSEGVMGDEAIINKQAILPSVNDPKLWQVRVKKNCERIAVMALLNKSIDFSRQGKPLSILSATCSDATEGYVYVEAFKEIHVREATKGLHFILNKFILVPQEEMPVIYQNDKAQDCELKKHQWVRIRQGLYNNDIGLVEKIENDKVFVRVIPRIEPQSMAQDPKKKNRFARIPQRMFNEKSFKDVIQQNNKVLNKHFYVWKNQLFRKGFLYRPFPFKHVDPQNAKPTHDEIQAFTAGLGKTEDLGDSSDIDDGQMKLEDIIKATYLQGGQAYYGKGDKIKIIKGDLTNMNGTVVSIEESVVTFKPMGIPNYTRNLQIDIQHISKYFEPGDMVRIVEGKYKGETGQVIDVDGKLTIVILDQTQQEVKLLANFLKLKSDLDHTAATNSLMFDRTTHSYEANDLVSYNNNKFVGLVLQVQEDYLKVINEQGKTENVKVANINKKISKMGSNKALGRDSKGNSLAVNHMVRCSNGQYKGMTGPIRHIYKNYLFLWNKEFVQSNGIFVESSRNVEILGSEFLKGSSQGQQAIASQNRMVRDPLVGKTIIIIKGQFKGHRGRVTYADDKQAIVELNSKCKKIPIDKMFCQIINPEDRNVHNDEANKAQGGASAYGGATAYDGGKTPMAINTPSYYPQSCWGGQAEFDNDDNNNNNAGNGASGAPSGSWANSQQKGSEYGNAMSYTSTDNGWNNVKREQGFQQPTQPSWQS